MQLVNTSANRLHCRSAPSAALVGDVRLTDSNAATQANIAHAANSTTTLWVHVQKVSAACWMLEQAGTTLFLRVCSLVALQGQRKVLWWPTT